MQVGLFELCRSWAALATGEPRLALEQAEAALAIFSGRAQKFEWRARVAIADALLDLDRVDEAAAILPAALDARARSRTWSTTAPRGSASRSRSGGSTRRPRSARRSRRPTRLRYPATVALAVEALVAGGRVDRAEAVVAGARAWERRASPLAEASARIALARGDAQRGGRAARAGVVEQAEAAGSCAGRGGRGCCSAEALAAAGDARARARRAPAARRRGGARPARCAPSRAAAALGARLGLDVSLPPDADDAAPRRSCCRSASAW